MKALAGTIPAKAFMPIKQIINWSYGDKEYLSPDVPFFQCT
jgi:hypothetical protein